MVNRYKTQQSFGMRPSWSYTEPTSSIPTTSLPSAEDLGLEDLSNYSDTSGEGYYDSSVNSGGRGNNMSPGQMANQAVSTGWGAFTTGLGMASLAGGNALAAPGVIGGLSNFGNTNYNTDPGWFGRGLDSILGTTPLGGYGGLGNLGGNMSTGFTDVDTGKYSDWNGMNWDATPEQSSDEATAADAATGTNNGGTDFGDSSFGYSSGSTDDAGQGAPGTGDW